jgi:hypothetical protein
MRTGRKAPGLRVVGGLDFTQPEDGARAASRAFVPRQPTVDVRSTSPTAVNARLRIKRREIYRKAEAVVEYWSARWRLDSAIRRAQSHGVFECQGPVDDERATLKRYREATVKQMLTPAPDAAAIAWKQKTFARGDYRHIDANPEQIKRAIADDLAFLAAHPTRRSNSEAMARSREFKEAMRMRIMDVARSRSLTDEEIRPALTLKHHEIARFSERHGVSIEWLLEGRAGRGCCELMDILDGDGA